jgi:hypothetical protein
MLSGLFGNLSKAGISSKPQMQGNMLTFDITEQELAGIALKDMPAQGRQAITLQCHEGKITITVKLL